jgi:CBS domain-containing protein
MITGAIGHFASRPVVAVDAECTVLDAIKLMSAKRISCLVVLVQGEPIGILTERDIVFAANWVLGQPDLLLKEVMSKPVLTASEETTIKEACQIFSDNSIRHLVVLDYRMEMTGIFTQTDLVRALDKVVFRGIKDLSGLISRQVWHIAPDVSARYALALMASHAISGIVVMDGDEVCGVFTERDVVRLIAAGVDLNTIPVREVMSAPVISVPVSTAPRDAIAKMQDSSVRRLVVTNGGSKLAGILTRTDISRAFEGQEQTLISDLVGKTPPINTGAVPSP